MTRIIVRMDGQRRCCSASTISTDNFAACKCARILLPAAGPRLLKANTQTGTQSKADGCRGRRMRVRHRAWAGRRALQETFLKRSRDSSAREVRPNPVNAGWLVDLHGLELHGRSFRRRLPSLVFRVIVREATTLAPSDCVK